MATVQQAESELQSAALTYAAAVKLRARARENYRANRDAVRAAESAMRHAAVALADAIANEQPAQAVRP